MSNPASQFEAVIGLEVHCQLATRTKIFCGCPASPPLGVSVADVPTNAHTCPVCAGHPGTLPALNAKVVEYAVMAGLATHCEIRSHNVFARKNYFYPDLPKGYQISQFDEPICENGWLEVDLGTGARKIPITRIHMEEDAGKSVHGSGYSIVNLNRAGVPLIEIVSAPEMRSAAEAGAYLRALHAIVTYLEICDGNMQEGNFRCDANVSVRPRGAKELGTRVEIKNVNSFRFVEKAIDYEITRQIQVILSGGRLVQETRSYDSARNATSSMRSKEQAQDYRYFPDPDLIPLRLDSTWVEKIRSSLPELPAERRLRYRTELGLSEKDAGAITDSKPMADFFERTIDTMRTRGMEPKASAKAAANWLTVEITRLLHEDGIELVQSRLEVEHVVQLVLMTHSGELSSTGAKRALGAAWKTGESVATIVERDGLRQVSDLGALEPAIQAVLAEFPAQVADLKAGKEKIIGFLVGQVMKRMDGKANPSLIQDLIRKKL